ncbi:MAG: ribulokinase [Kiritimatiellae bacterium]|nr:ribulokinase [Kiritimatiellia bacterium]
MKKASYLGLDFGSDSVRALLVDEEGLPLAEAVRPYPRWGEGRYTDAAAGRFRQHPLDYVEAMTDAVREALAQGDPASVAGIGVDTTGSTPCLTDAAGLPLALRPEFADDPDAMFILWKDHTALEEADRINEAAHSGDGPDYTAYEGGIYSCEWFWSKVLHVLRANPRVRAAAAGAIEHCDWMPAVLTGGHPVAAGEQGTENGEQNQISIATPNPIRQGNLLSPISHPLSPISRRATARRSRCAAGHKAMWHASWGGLPPESFFERIDPLLVPLRRAMPGESFTADNPVGRLSPEWAARLGLPAGIPVAGGMVDGHCGAVGAGIRPGTLVKVCGTSACDFLVAERVDGLIPGICGQIDGSIVPGLVGLEAGQAAFGDVYAWLRRFLSYAGDVSVAAIERDAAALAPGSTGLVALDWFNGRRTPYPDDTRTGAITGLNLGTTVPMVYRALAEATVFGSKRIKDHFAAHGVTADNLVMTGGISRKSPFVMQMFADVFGQPVQIAACDQTCALGAAIFAAVAAGAYASVPEAMDHMASRIDRVYRPDPAAGEVYAKLYSKYCLLAAAGGKQATNG